MMGTGGGRPPVPPRPTPFEQRLDAIEKRLGMLERSGKLTEEQFGKLLGELAELKTAIAGGLANLSGRIDEVHTTIDGEVRGQLDSITDEVEAQAGEQKQLATLVQRLRRERDARKEAERESIRVTARAGELETRAVDAEKRATEERRRTRRRSNQLIAALVAAAGAFGAALGDKVIAHWGGPTPAPAAVDGGRP